jgi:hypothetical protein
MFVSFSIYKNPNTGEHASLFVHNIRSIIVTDNITVHCDNGGEGYKTLKQLGFTEKLDQGAGITID